MIKERRGIALNPVYRDINASTSRYRVFWGSAGSGKSVNIAYMLVTELSNPANAGMHCLVVRKSKDSNADSTRAELISAIRNIFGPSYRNEWEVPQGRLTLTHKTTGNMFIFRGVKDENQREQLKSIAVPFGSICRCWIEEATQLTKEDFAQIDTRLRGELPAGWYYQINLSFNPISQTSWIKRRFFDYNDADATTCHSTWRDNRFIDDSFKDQMNKQAKINPEFARIYSEGLWGEKGGRILTNFVIENVDQDITHYDAIALGQDFGFNHANAILLLGWKDGEVYVIREHYKHEKTSADIIREIETSQLFADAQRARAFMICDAAEPDRIKEWQRAGWHARPVDKGSGKATTAAINWLKSRRIHIDVSAENTAEEAAEWTWQRDRSTGLYTDEPVPVNDDAMAALRYGTEPFRIKDARQQRRK